LQLAAHAKQVLLLYYYIYVLRMREGCVREVTNKKRCQTGVAGNRISFELCCEITSAMSATGGVSSAWH
jgi:hypothetical protein